MKLLDLTLDTPEENLALDEALLEQAEAVPQDDGGEVLRLWEATRPMVVIGRSTRITEEVDLELCRELQIPVLRRSSGGASIVAGPGCLMYGVVLSRERRPQLAQVDEAHRTVLEPLARSLARLLPGVEWAGTSDLAIVGRKFSGNSLRVKRTHLVYHGTLLYDFPLDLVGRVLRTPPRQPEYRAGRAHGDFVTNLPLGREELRRAVIEAFGACEPLADWPREATAALAREKYAHAEWNHRL